MSASLGKEPSCCEDSPRSASGRTTWPRPGPGTPSCSASRPYLRRPGYVEFRIGDYQHELGLIDSRYAPDAAERAGRRDRVLARRRPGRRRVERLLALGATEYQPLARARPGFRDRLGRRPVRQHPGRHVQPALPGRARQIARSVKPPTGEDFAKTRNPHRGVNLEPSFVGRVVVLHRADRVAVRAREEDQVADAADGEPLHEDGARRPDRARGGVHVVDGEGALEPDRGVVRASSRRCWTTPRIPGSSSVPVWIWKKPGGPQGLNVQPNTAS